MSKDWPRSAFEREVDPTTSKFIEARTLLQEAVAWIRLEDDPDLVARIRKFLGTE